MKNENVGKHTNVYSETEKFLTTEVDKRPTRI